jgi:hypothetical protein
LNNFGQRPFFTTRSLQIRNNLDSDMNQPIIETLFMVSEYVSGPAQIAGMILAGMRPILWAPSAIVIDKAFEIGHSILSSRDLLGLIEMGLVRIAARERWLTDRNHRQNYRWDGAKWFSPFDEQVLKWFKEDIGKPVPRVVGFPPQDGTDWALAQRNRQDNEAKKRIKRAGFLLQEGLLPDGLRERANEVDSPEKKVDIVLRDIRNTEVARDRLGKPILVTAPYSTDAMATLFEDLTLGHHCDDQQVSPELLVEFADLATSIVSGTIKDAKELEKRYRSCLDIGLARLMAKLLVGDQISLAERLAHEVRDSQRAEFWRPLLANLKFRSPHRLTLAGVLLGALSSAVAGKSTTGMRSIIGQKIQNLISDLPDREQLRRGLFLTFHGAEKLEYQQMEVLRRRFKELSRKKRKLSVPLRAEDATSFPKPDIN